MNTPLLKLVSAGLFFIIIFILGFWLSRSGKPYGTLIFTIHKLVALGAVVYLAVTFNKVHQVSPLSPVQIAAIVLAFLCFAVTIITGGLVSIEKTMPEVVHRLHQVMPYLTVLSTAASLYLVLGISRLALSH